MRNYWKLFILLLVGLATPVGLSGQARSPEAGDRIRVWTEVSEGTSLRLRSVTGQLQLWTTDTLNLLADEEPRPRTIASASVARLDISAGRPRGAGALRGAGIGLLAGVITGVAMGLAAGDDDPDTFIAFSAEDKALLLAFVLGVPGTAVGAIAGAANPREVWRNTRVPGR